MPYADTSDGVRLYFEAHGNGTPIIFLHEFAADHASWEPQVRHFSRTHRCITYSARGYLPSHVPSEEDAYTYERFRDDGIAVLDHLQIEAAHFVGLSMGAYSSLQVGLQGSFQRAVSPPSGRHWLGLRNRASESVSPDSAMSAQRHSKETGPKPSRRPSEWGQRGIPFLLKNPSGFRQFYDALAKHDAAGSAFTMRVFQGRRPPLSAFEKRDASHGLTDADHGRRRR